MGVETEFGILGGWTRGRAQAIQNRVEAQVHFRSAKGSGVFLPNGARCYIDHERHNEYATPECHGPDELVVHELAGRRFLQSCAEQAGQTLLCSNVDPVTGSAWGTHENYRCERHLTAAEQTRLEIHLVTRLIFTGAGGVDFARPGFRLVLSPRAAFLERRHSRQGQVVRSLVFAKPDDHGAGHRLHVFSGETLLGQVPNYLKYASTAMVALLLSQGVAIGPSGFAAPVLQVLNQVNRDLAVRRRFALQESRRLTAIEIQRWLADDVARHLHRLPAWAPVALERWNVILDHLESGDPILCGQLDWLVFRCAARRLLAETGCEPAEARRAIRFAAPPSPGNSAWPGRPGNDRGRWLLAELYSRLHVVGGGSLYHELERRGVVDSRLPEITPERLVLAKYEPPPGRATHRSRLSARYAADADCLVTWERLTNRRTRQWLPFPEDPAEEPTETWLSQPRTEFPQSLQEAYLIERDFRAGRYLRVLERCQAAFPGGPESLGPSLLETYCLALARAGRWPDAAQALEEYRRKVPPFAHAAIAVACLNLRGLSPCPDQLGPAITHAESCLATPTPGERIEAYHHFTFRLYQARLWMRQGRLTEAEVAFRDLLTSDLGVGRVRMQSRIRCYLAETLRLLGQSEAGLAILQTALETYRREAIDGDHAENGLLTWAKFVNDGEAAAALGEAERRQRDLGHGPGLARTLCVRARRLGWESDFDEIRRLAREVPTLADCRLLSRILSRWAEWRTGFRCEPPDDYWGL